MRHPYVDRREEAHSAAMALDVGGERMWVAQDARASRRRQSGEKQRTEQEQDLREHGDAV